VIDRPVNVIVARGHVATPWELRQWEGLPERFSVSWLQTAGNTFDPGALRIRPIPVRTLRDRLGGRVLGAPVARVIGDRYLGLDDAVRGADVLHAEELSFWFAADVARAGGRLRVPVVQTVWETLPLLEAYRTPHARGFRRTVLQHTDLFLATTERAREALLLEGVDEQRIEVSPPGIDVERFRAAQAGSRRDRHLLVAPGRLVWEKGHHDLLRALALLHRGRVRPPSGEVVAPKLLIVGTGPEERRLREHARELGLAEAVDLRSVPYDEMPSIYAQASAMVLASLPSSTAQLHPFDKPRAFWEEQFGYVLAEAMAARLAIVAAASGAIAEVVGDGAALFAPGDWPALARALADGPLAQPPGERVDHDPARLALYSLEAAADRLAAAYDQVLAGAESRRA
jgi:glycosyltransferase involved in cell wall biosynthesis